MNELVSLPYPKPFTSPKTLRKQSKVPIFAQKAIPVLTLLLASEGLLPDTDTAGVVISALSLLRWYSLREISFPCFRSSHFSSSQLRATLIPQRTFGNVETSLVVSVVEEGIFRHPTDGSWGFYNAQGSPQPQQRITNK